MDRWRELVSRLFAWGLSGLFIYAGVLKVLRPDELLTDILSYQLVSYAVAWVSAFLLPGVELAAAGGLLFRSFRREAAWLVILMMGVFIVALASAWARGLDISCGCFGKSEMEANYPWLIGRDVIIAAAAGVVLWGSKR